MGNPKMRETKKACISISFGNMGNINSISTPSDRNLNISLSGLNLDDLENFELILPEQILQAREENQKVRIPVKFKIVPRGQGSEESVVLPHRSISSIVTGRR